MLNVTSKLEINANDPMVPINEINDFAVKHKVAAIVVYDWQVISSLVQLRMSSGGKYSIILAVDFPNGNEYVLDKFKVFSKDIDMSLIDGFDILLTSRKPDGNPPGEIETLNEVQAFRDFLMSINRTYQVRYVIDIFSKETTLVDYALKAFKTVPPILIRLDHNLKMPDRVNKESIQKAVDTVRKYTAAPVKVSTNVDLDLIRAVSAPRYDVTFEAAKEIIEQLQNPETDTKIEAKVEASKTTSAADVSGLKDASKPRYVELGGHAVRAQGRSGMGGKGK